MPDEQNQLYKKHSLHFPDAYLSGSKNMDVNTTHAGGGVIGALRRLGIEVDLIVRSDGTVTGSGKGIRILEGEDLLRALDVKLFKSGDDKMSALVNSRTARIIGINAKKGDRLDYTILFLNSGGNLFTQVMADVEDGAELRLSEIFASEPAGRRAAVGITNEFRVRDGGSADITVLHNEDENTAVINLHSSVIGSSGRLGQVHVYAGGAYAKAKGNIDLAGDSGSGDVTEIVIGAADQRIDIETNIRNASRDSVAGLESRAVMLDSAACILKGFARIETGAVGSRSFVNEKGMIINGSAKIDALPGMKINEGDVKATHSSTTAPIDDESKFYMASRGIDAKTSEMLIVDGFLGSMLLRIRNPRIMLLSSLIIQDKLANRRYGRMPAPSSQMRTFDNDAGNIERAEDIEKHYKYRNR